jgi:Kdo2-lipid IVA lauroyltransferase/acyltransferase
MSALNALVAALVTRFFLAICQGLSYLPYSLIRALSQVIGTILWHGAGARRKIALRNLALCFPEWSDEKRQSVAKAHFKEFVRSFFDRFILWHHSADAIKKFVRLEGLENLTKHAGKPVILLAPHFLGMDAGGMRLQIEMTLASMYAKQKNPIFNRAMTQGRMRFNNATMLLRTEGVRPAMRIIKKGTPFYLLPDMDLGPKDAVFVPFFGVPAATVTTVARLALATNAVVIPIITEQTAYGYIARIGPAWENYPGVDVEAATLAMNRFIEKEVAKFPEQYLWTHKRFKTRPLGAPSVYQ